MSGSKPSYLVAALVVIALAVIAYTVFLRPPADTKQSLSPKVSTVADQLDSLLADDVAGNSKQTLIQHLKQLLADDDWQTIGTELAMLRHGRNTDKAAFDYISESVSENNDVRDYANASRLGKWLGAVRIALQGSKDNAKASAQKLEALLAGLDATTKNASVGVDYEEDFASVVSDVQTNNINLASAIELIAYAEVTQSDITTPINNAIEKMLRNN